MLIFSAGDVVNGVVQILFIILLNYQPVAGGILFGFFALSHTVPYLLLYLTLTRLIVLYVFDLFLFGSIFMVASVECVLYFAFVFALLDPLIIGAILGYKGHVHGVVVLILSSIIIGQPPILIVEVGLQIAVVALIALFLHVITVKYDLAIIELLIILVLYLLHHFANLCFLVYFHLCHSVLISSISFVALVHSVHILLGSLPATLHSGATIAIITLILVPIASGCSFVSASIIMVLVVSVFHWEVTATRIPAVLIYTLSVTDIAIFPVPVSLVAHFVRLGPLAIGGRIYIPIPTALFFWAIVHLLVASSFCLLLQVPVQTLFIVIFIVCFLFVLLSLD